MDFKDILSIHDAFLFVIVYNLIFLGEPIKVDVTRYWAVPQWLRIHLF